MPVSSLNEENFQVQKQMFRKRCGCGVWIKPLPGMPASLMGTNLSVSAAPLPIQLPVPVPGEAAEDASSTRISITLVRDPDGAPGSWFW